MEKLVCRCSSPAVDGKKQYIEYSTMWKALDRALYVKVNVSQWCLYDRWPTSGIMMRNHSRCCGGGFNYFS